MEYCRTWKWWLFYLRKWGKEKNIYFFISVKPELITNERFTCNTTDLVRLSCYIPGNFQVFQFLQWQKHVNDQLIKNFTGQTKGNISVIELDKCSYEYAGQYTCAACITHKNKTYFINKTTEFKSVGKMYCVLFICNHFFYFSCHNSIQN